MSTRPSTQLAKPPVFQRPHKPKPTTKIAKRPPIKKSKKPLASLSGSGQTQQTIGKVAEETNLLVKLPSVESDDYKTPTSSSSSSDEDFEEGEVDSEPLDQETSQAILSQEEDEERFSGANSPW